MRLARVSWPSRVVGRKSSRVWKRTSALERGGIIMHQQQQAPVQFRPCIDIHKGKVKQIVGSTLRDEDGNDDMQLRTNFESEKSSNEFAKQYKTDRLIGGHVIMLDRSEETKLQALEALRAYPGGLQIGGGITSENAAEYLDAGASHVIVTSFVFRDGQVDEGRLADIVKVVGKGRLVLDLSCRKREGSDNYFVVTDRWQKFTDFVINEHNLQSLAKSCDEFLIHGVDVEGKGLGIDVNLLRLIAATSCIPLTYAGGVRSIDDLELVKREGLGRVHATVGSALDMFGGPLEYEKVLSWHNEQMSLAKIT